MKSKKVLALILTLSLLFCFAACGKTDIDETTTTLPTTTQPTTVPTTIPTTVPTTLSTTLPTTETTAVTTTQPAPTDALSVFNNALLISKPVSATYDRTAITGKFETGDSKADKFLNGFIGSETLTPQNAVGLPADVSAFTSIYAENISSSNISDNGTTYVLTFNLNNIQVSSTDKPAKGGYMYFMDGNEATSAIQKANDQIVMKNIGTVSLSNGILTVNIDKSNNRIVSAKLTLKEVYHDDIDLSMFEIPAMMASLIPEKISSSFEYSLTVNYTF